MNCDDFEERYDRLLDDESLPPSLALHLARCPRCSARVEIRRRAIELYRLPQPAEEMDLVGRVMAALPFLPRPRREVAMRNWILAGVILASSIVLVPAQGVFSGVIDTYGPQWMLPFVLVFGFGVAIFGAFFIKTHMDELSNRFGINEHIVH
jgi:hypothetical protein